MRPIETTAPITPASAEAAARFRLSLVETSATAPALWREAIESLAQQSPGVSLVTGPSGSGKSRLARVLVRTLLSRGERVVVVDAEPLRHEVLRPTIDAVGPGTLDERLSRLARAGLGEASLFARPPAALSEGEGHRVALARAMSEADNAPKRCWIVADEFASVLDRATAQALAHTCARWVRALRGRVCLVAAGAHEDLPRLLGPDLTIEMPGCRVRGARAARPVRLEIGPGDRADLDRLSPHHYRAGRPATIDRVLQCVRRLPGGGSRTAGVLVASRPTLNGAHRELAWPGRYHGARNNAEKREQAARINRELRCISRVIVSPCSRGLGVARRLVEAYLRDPLTPATESIATMGASCPFFERAGMRAYRLEPSRATLRFADALEARALAPTDVCAQAGAEVAARDDFLIREARRWAMGRGRARVRGGGDASLITAAASALLSPGVAFAWSAS